MSDCPTNLGDSERYVVKVRPPYRNGGRYGRYVTEIFRYDCCATVVSIENQINMLNMSSPGLLYETRRPPRVERSPPPGRTIPGRPAGSPESASS